MKNSKQSHIFAATILTILLVLSGCSTYNVNKPELTPEKTTDYEKQIEDALTQLENKDLTIEEKVTAMQTEGIGYERLGKYDNAIKIYEEILKIAPTNFIALNNLTAIYEEAGDLVLARKYVGILHNAYKNDAELNQGVVGDSILILVKNKEFDTALNVLQEYAKNYQSKETTAFISDQYEYIGRMKKAAEETSK